MDFTRPWLRGMKIIPRKDANTPPRLVPVIKTVPLKDEEGNIIKPRVIHGNPLKCDPWIKPKNGEDNNTT